MKEKKRKILELLDGHRLMSIGTRRPDGWPHVTTVGYVNDGFLVYCFIASNSQKHAHVLADDRISIAIGCDSPDPLAIKGLSLTGHAEAVEDPREFEHVSRLRLRRYPEYAAPVMLDGDARAADRAAASPARERVVLLRIVPEMITLVDYSRGFGHSDVVTFSHGDLDIHVASRAHRWDTAP